MVLEQLVLPEGRSTHSTLVRQMGRLQGLVVVLGHVVQQLPLINLKEQSDLVILKRTHESSKMFDCIYIL